MKERIAFSFGAVILFLIASPSCSSFLIVLSISPPSIPFSRRKPIFQLSLRCLMFIIWSAKQGWHSIGTLPLVLYMIEFHPQCVQKPPTAEWPKTLFLRCPVDNVCSLTYHVYITLWQQEWIIFFLILQSTRCEPPIAKAVCY